MKNNKIIVVVVMVLAFIMGGLVNNPTAHAEEGALSVKAILPKNQFNKNVSYYYVKVEPGDRQDLELEIFNSSKEEVTALVNLTAATTNDGGMIDYNLPDKKLDASMLVPFTDIASTPEEVVIPAGKSVVTKISLELPADKFEGMVLGGINVRAKPKKEKEDNKSGGGMKIVNEMNYALGVVLLEDETLVPTNMLYGKTSAGQVMGSNTFKVNLRNDTPAVIEDLTIEAQIFRKGSDKVLYETTKEGYRMAPNSNFDFGVPLGKDRFRPGEYQVKIVATSDPKDPEVNGEKQVWTFEESFTVSPDEAKKLNAKAIGVEPDYMKYYIIGGVAAAGIVLLIILFVVLRKRKKKAAAIELAKANDSKKRKSGRNSKNGKNSKSSKRKRSSK